MKTLSDPATVCCMIEDSGPGIDPTHLPRIFDSFFITKDTGMGIGLRISRSIKIPIDRNSNTTVPDICPS